MSDILSVHGLTKSFAGHASPVVDGIDFTVKAGEIFVLLGPSGCGKTTTLRMIGGFERPDAGDIRLAGELLVGDGTFAPPEARGIGFVFQDYALFPHLSVGNNVGYGLRELSKAARAKKVAELLELVGLAALVDRMPQELSGGEQQRIALARALARQPKLLLLDEPFSNLDEQRRTHMRDELRGLLKAQGMSAIMVTHHQEEALTMGDRVGIMRDGVLVQVASPADLYGTPETAFVADFLGTTNLLRGEAKGSVAMTLLGSLQMTPDATGDVLLSLRAEQISLSLVEEREGEDAPDTPAAQATIVARQFFGHTTRYQLQCGEERLFAMTLDAAPLPEGASVALSVRGVAQVVKDDL